MLDTLARSSLRGCRCAAILFWASHWNYTECDDSDARWLEVRLKTLNVVVVSLQGFADGRFVGVPTLPLAKSVFDPYRT